MMKYFINICALIYLFLLCTFLSCRGLETIRDTPKVRVIIVSGEHPKDGHLRQIRSANARSLNPVLLKVKREESEITEILKLLENTKHQNNELTILTPSDNFLFLGESMTLSSVIASTALVGEGSVVMAFPLRNTTNVATKYDDDLNEISKKFDKYADEDDRPRPKTHKAWRESVGIFAKYKYTNVKVLQELQRNAELYDDRFCAFAGFTSAIHDMLKEAKKLPADHKIRSLKDICIAASDSSAIRYKLGITKDRYNKVFERIRHNVDVSDNANFGYSYGFNNSVVVFSPKYSYAPIIFDSPDKMPFEIANFATSNILLKLKCDVCSDNQIEDFDQLYRSEEKYPIVHVVVVTPGEVRALDEFLENLSSLNYPKSRMILSVFFSLKNDKDEETAKETFSNRDKEMLRYYKSVSIANNPELKAIDLFKVMWVHTQEIKANFTLILDPSVRMHDKKIIQHLIEQNRRLVAPLLLVRPGQSDLTNIATDRLDRDLKHNSLTQGYITKTIQQDSVFSYVGSMQIPSVVGAIMLKNEVFDELEIPFHTCFLKCSEDDLKCIEFNEEMKKQNCSDSYYKDIHDDFFCWGMMTKQMQEQGLIPYVNNEYDYGIIVNT